MINGIELIQEEREKQLAKWSDKHDNEHRLGELAKVAALLATRHTDATVAEPDGFIVGYYDSWGLAEKYEYNPIKMLTIAGALIAAEIDRLQSYNR